MQTRQRLCGKFWCITAKNGDYFELERGKEYTTSKLYDDNTVTVFSNYWVPRVPVDVFYEQD